MTYVLLEEHHNICAMRPLEKVKASRGHMQASPPLHFATPHREATASGGVGKVWTQLHMCCSSPGLHFWTRSIHGHHAPDDVVDLAIIRVGRAGHSVHWEFAQHGKPTVRGRGGGGGPECVCG